MRLNVYTEEMLRGEPGDPPLAEIVHADYISSRTGQPMRNYGLRIFLKSHPDLHYIPGRDDDRSAVTFWLGPKDKNVIIFLETLLQIAQGETLRIWREKTAEVQRQAEAAEGVS
jgi:hypothetical protein